MSGQPILIAALSGRALAASARRAGFLPYVVDAFGDEDTRILSEGITTLPGVLRNGFRKSELLPVLDDLTPDTGGEPIGLVLGPGFEDSPKLVAELANHYSLAGCGAEALARAKDPKLFFGLLSELGIEHPAISFSPPRNPLGWLSKRIGACGGRHIRRLAEGKTVSASPHRYFQRELEGVTISALAITGVSGTAFAFSRSWSAPRGREPFRYGGSVSAEEIDADLEARLIDACLSLINPLQLVGLVSFDFLVSGNEAKLLEVNPRPGASLDVLDDASGTLFKAHIAACGSEDAVDVLARNWRPEPSAAAYLYADAGPVEIGNLEWPDWVSDVPHRGEQIREGAPIATVHAKAGTPALATEICAKRLQKLAAVVYEPQNEQDN